MFKREKTEKLKNNIKYLIKSRGETQQSLSNASGVTRTTIYNILEGRVVNAQQSTIRKISDFFGVSYTEIETVSFEERDGIGNSVFLQEIINPAAVPVIKERFLIRDFDKALGELVATHALTYYFGTACNLIGVHLENEIVGKHEPGDVLIIKRGLSHNDKEKLAFDNKTKKLLVTCEPAVGIERVRVVGEIVEERFNG